MSRNLKKVYPFQRYESLGVCTTYVQSPMGSEVLTVLAPTSFLTYSIITLCCTSNGGWFFLPWALSSSFCRVTLAKSSINWPRALFLTSFFWCTFLARSRSQFATRQPLLSYNQKMQLRLPNAKNDAGMVDRRALDVIPVNSFKGQKLLVESLRATRRYCIESFIPS